MPLIPGMKNIGRNIRELHSPSSKPRPNDQIIAIAMRLARKKPKK